MKQAKTKTKNKAPVDLVELRKSLSPRLQRVFDLTEKTSKIFKRKPLFSDLSH